MTSKTFVSIASLVLLGATLYWDRSSTARELLVMKKEVQRLRATQLEGEAARAQVPVFDGNLRSRLATAARGRADATMALETARNAEAPGLDEDKLSSRAEVLQAAANPVDDDDLVAMRARLHTKMETAFHSQDVDSGWARTADAAVRSAIYENLPRGSQVTGLDCRTSMCRLETVHPSIAQYQEFTEHALDDVEKRPWNGGFASVPVAVDPKSGQVTLATFLLREGHALPSDDESELSANE